VSTLGRPGARGPCCSRWGSGGRSGRCASGRASCGGQQGSRSRGASAEGDRPSASWAGGAGGRDSGAGEEERRGGARGCRRRTRRGTLTGAGPGDRSGSVCVVWRALGAAGRHAGTGAGAAPSRRPTSLSGSVWRGIGHTPLGSSRTLSWSWCSLSRVSSLLYLLRCHDHGAVPPGITSSV
jgi:hypothetical protein